MLYGVPELRTVGKYMFEGLVVGRFLGSLWVRLWIPRELVGAMCRGTAPVMLASTMGSTPRPLLGGLGCVVA